jgi:glutaredoxin
MSACESGRPESVVVYWRAGCGYCDRLFAVLDRAGVRITCHDIWSDDEARHFVQVHNCGDETVPTVVVGSWVGTNPDPAKLLRLVWDRHPHLMDEDPR